MKTKQIDHWNANFYQTSKLYQPIIESFLKLSFSPTTWPELKDYQSLIDSKKKPIVNSNNKSIGLVKQSVEFSKFQDQYEPRIFLTGEVQTRTRNWHDFFQVLVWHCFPNTKSYLNKLHYEASTARRDNNHSNTQRSSTENFLTLFDECGVVIVATENETLNLIRNFKWSELFLENRHKFEKSIDCFIFGHAMYEKALNPYIGMTGNALLITVENAFFDLNYQNKLISLDKLIVEKIQSTDCPTPKSLNPLPILGVPGWHDENEDAKFYSNKRYFREGRSRKKA